MTLPKPGDTVLYHINENGLDDWVEATVRKVEPPMTTGVIPVKVHIKGAWHDTWAPLSLLRWDGDGS